jgi:hypothetical protein
MTRTRPLLILLVLLFCALNPPAATADCPGVICGGQCNYEGLDYCIYVWGGDQTIGCKAVDGRGCMSMHSAICCPRDPAP